MTFKARALPQVIIVDDYTILGPFCARCGNPQDLHREDDEACPKRRLNPYYPRGEREKGCTCGAKPRPECPVFQYHYNPGRDRAYAERILVQRVTTKEALTVRCPSCNAGVGEPCHPTVWPGRATPRNHARTTSPHITRRREAIRPIL